MVQRRKESSEKEDYGKDKSPGMERHQRIGAGYAIYMRIQGRKWGGFGRD